MKKLAEIEQLLCTVYACERSALSEHGTMVVWSNSLMDPPEHRQIEERDQVKRTKTTGSTQGRPMPTMERSRARSRGAEIEEAILVALDYPLVGRR